MNELEQAGSLEKELLLKSATARRPVSGSLELTPCCNMNCDMCYVRLPEKERAARGDLLTVEEWLGIAQQMRDAGALFLLLTGGEPLLYPGFRELFRELAAMGFVLSVNTNGTLIDEEWADFFAELRPRWINVTLYGAGEETYRRLCHYSGFEKTVRGIRLLRERGVDVRISATIVRDNVRDLEGILVLSEKLDAPVNADTFMIASVRERGVPFRSEARLPAAEAARAAQKARHLTMTEEEYRQYLEFIRTETDTEQMHEHPPGMSCLAGKCSFAVSWQGMMRPCVLLDRPEMPVINRDGAGAASGPAKESRIMFEEAWKYISEEVEKIRLNPKCGTCALRSVCRTCAACALYETGRFDGLPEYACEYGICYTDAQNKEADE